MDFFKNPKYKSIRLVLILVIIIGAGWFTMNNMNQSKSNQGSVINQAPTKSNITSTTNKETDTSILCGGNFGKSCNGMIPGDICGGTCTCQGSGSSKVCGGSGGSTGSGGGGTTK